MRQASYERDFYAWLTQQATHLRAQEWDAIHIETATWLPSSRPRSTTHHGSLGSYTARYLGKPAAARCISPRELKTRRSVGKILALRGAGG